MTIFFGEPVKVLLACFQCGTHISEEVYESLPGKILYSMVDNGPEPWMVRPLLGSSSVSPRQGVWSTGQPHLELVRSIVRCYL